MTGGARQMRCPEDVLGWIPWYGDEGLSERQRGAVQAHAAECAECRAELEMIAGAPYEIDGDLPDPDQAFAEVTARIAREEGAGSPVVLPTEPSRLPPALPERELTQLADWALSSSPSRGRADSWRRGAAWAAAALVLLGVGGLVGSMLDAGPTGGDPAGAVYTLATTPDGSRGPELDVVFREQASLAEISAALQAVGGEIVAGPTPLGVYRIRLAADAAPGSEPAAKVAAARLGAGGLGVAILAEPVP